MLQSEFPALQLSNVRKFFFACSPSPLAVFRILSAEFLRDDSFIGCTFAPLAHLFHATVPLPFVRLLRQRIGERRAPLFGLADVFAFLFLLIFS